MKKTIILLSVLAIILTGCGLLESNDSETVTINGTYYYSSDTESFGFMPLEGQGMVIENPEEALTIMGIEDDYINECPDFHGSAEFLVESVEIPEEEAYGTAPRAKLLELISNSGMTCGKYQ